MKRTIILFLSSAALLHSENTLTCYTGDSAWGTNACVLRFAEPLAADNWILVQFKEEYFRNGLQTVQGRYPAGTQRLGFSYGAEIELIQVQGETLVPRWVEVEIQPAGPPVMAQAPKRGWWQRFRRLFR